MKKFVCSVCGYVHEGDTPPAQCRYVRRLLRNLKSRPAI